MSLCHMNNFTWYDLPIISNDQIYRREDSKTITGNQK